MSGADQIVLPKEITECCRANRCRARACARHLPKKSMRKIGSARYCLLRLVNSAGRSEMRRQFFETMSNAAREMIAATVAANAAACDNPASAEPWFETSEAGQVDECSSITPTARGPRFWGRRNPCRI